MNQKQLDISLCRMVEYGVASAVKVLIEAGADVTAGDNWAIRWASYRGYTDIVKLLIEAGADVTAGNNWAIRYANGAGHTGVVKLLIDAGADVTIQDSYAITRWASGRCHQEIVKLIHQLY